MNFLQKGSLLVALSSVMSVATAGSFMLTEQSITGMGRSYAGAGIVGDDLSAAWYNPAGMTLLTGTQFQMGSAVGFLNFKYQGVDGNTDNGRESVVPVPNMYLVHQATDSLWVGLSVTVPFGMQSKYEDTGKERGREKGIKALVRVFDFHPSFAWKINPSVSVGGGVSLQYAECEFDTGVMPGVKSHLELDSWAWGADVGAMWKPTKDATLGLSWRTKTRHNLGGYFGVASILTPAEMNFRAPQNILLTGTYDVTPRLKCSGTVRWSDWSTFKAMDIQGRALSAKVNINYQDSWLFTVGADYRVNDAFTWRAGAGYEIGTQKDAADRLRTIPENNRLWLSVGATWHVSKNLQGDFAYLFLSGLGNTSIYDSYGKAGQFDQVHVHMLGAQFVYRFR